MKFEIEITGESEAKLVELANGRNQAIPDVATELVTASLGNPLEMPKTTDGETCWYRSPIPFDRDARQRLIAIKAKYGQHGKATKIVPDSSETSVSNPSATSCGADSNNYELVGGLENDGWRIYRRV